MKHQISYSLYTLEATPSHCVILTHTNATQAFLIQGTILIIATFWEAHTIATVVTLTTFQIGTTGNWYAYTFHIGISGETSRTRALFVVIVNGAQGIHATGLRLATWINALATLT